MLERNQIRWILTGSLLASLFVFYSFYLAVLDRDDFALGGATWSMFMASLIFTWRIVVSLLRYRLLHVEQLLQRGALICSSASWAASAITACWHWRSGFRQTSRLLARRTGKRS